MHNNTDKSLHLNKKIAGYTYEIEDLQENNEINNNFEENNVNLMQVTPNTTPDNKYGIAF